MPILAELYVATRTRNTADAETENLPVLVVQRGSDTVFTKPLFGGAFRTARGAGADNIRNVTGTPTAGIDPVSGQIWFGASAKDIVAQMEAEGIVTPLYFVRVGTDYYLRKGRYR